MLLLSSGTCVVIERTTSPTSLSWSLATGDGIATVLHLVIVANISICILWYISCLIFGQIVTPSRQAATGGDETSAATTPGVAASAAAATTTAVARVGVLTRKTSMVEALTVALASSRDMRALRAMVCILYVHHLSSFREEEEEEGENALESIRIDTTNSSNDVAVNDNVPSVAVVGNSNHNEKLPSSSSGASTHGSVATSITRETLSSSLSTSPSMTGIKTADLSLREHPLPGTLTLQQQE